MFCASVRSQRETLHDGLPQYVLRRRVARLGCRLLDWPDGRPPGRRGPANSAQGRRLRRRRGKQRRRARLRTLGSDETFAVSRVTGDDVRRGALDEFDVVIHPGGSGGGQGRSLEEEGRERVRDFVRRGGGFVGVCAGAYLATCDYEWSLGILDAKVIDRAHWARGFGNVDIGMTPEGKERLGEAADRLSIYYHQGPLLAPANDPAVEDYRPLAVYEGEIAKNGAPSGVMPGTTAIACGRFGAGSVICFSPHPERTEGYEDLLLRGVRLVAAKQGVKPAPVEPVAAEKPFPPGLRVAIYDHSTGIAKGPKALRRILSQDAGFVCRTVRPEDVQEGKLKSYDVLIMPGGSGSKQAEKLGAVGRENVRRFVRNGGGYVGICAGAYLATTNYPWSLQLLNAKVVDGEHWARGTGTVCIAFTAAGQGAFADEDGETEIYYGQGPLLAPGEAVGVPEYEPLATYQTEIAKKGAPSGVMIGTTAVGPQNDVLAVVHVPLAALDRAVAVCVHVFGDAAVVCRDGCD